MDKFQSTNTIKLATEVKPTSESKYYFQLGDTDFRLPTTNVISEYDGLVKRCKQEGDNIICVIPTTSYETLALLLVSLQNPSVAENLSFFHYLDEDISNTVINTWGQKKVNLFVPYLRDVEKPSSVAHIIEDNEEDINEITIKVYESSSTSLGNYFVSPIELPIDMTNHIPYCLLDKKYIPYSLPYINEKVKPTLVSYAIQYIHAYEVYCSTTRKLEPILYTNQFEVLQQLPNDEYKNCWTNHLYSKDIVKEPDVKVKANRSYLDTECIIKGRLKSCKHWSAIKTILDNNWGVVTGGFIAGCIFGTSYTDIDICIDGGVDPADVKELFEGEKLVEKKNNRFKVDNLDIFFSNSNYVHTISCFHFSVVRAFYDGHLHMLPSCLISIMNGGIIHVNHRRVKSKHVDSYLGKGYMFEKTDVDSILEGYKDLDHEKKINQSNKQSDGSFNVTYKFKEIAKSKGPLLMPSKTKPSKAELVERAKAKLGIPRPGMNKTGVSAPKLPIKRVVSDSDSDYNFD